ncbi:hypothetical protein ACVWZV_006377 [Bradyrhizobium sp. GM5.1]|jgi:hypothetical protein
MRGLIYIWGAGIPLLVGLEIYLATNALRNLAPGVERKDVVFLRRFADGGSPPGGRSPKHGGPDLLS